MNCRFIEVIVPLALPLPTLTYSTTERVSVGCRVAVPVGKSKNIVGIVWQTDVVEPQNSDKIKPIIEVLDCVPLINETQRKFVQWFSSYYLCSLSETLRTLCPQLFSNEFDGISSRYIKPKKAKKRKVESKDSEIEPQNEIRPPKLGFEIENESAITLLHTSSDIDIVALVAKYIEKNKTVLITAPTPEKAAAIHSLIEPFYSSKLCTSATSTKNRVRLTINLATGIAPQVVVGTRSALLLPYSSLSTVIITEEHSFYYRSYRVPYFSARDSAIMLGSLHKCKTLLISQFPTVENYYNAKSSASWSYQRVDPQKSLAELKSIILERGKEMISKYAIEHIGAALENGKKCVMLQNRRGIASYIECDICSHTPQCPNCSTSLNLHSHLLGCHYCGYSTSIEVKCSVCGGTMRRKGRGTQQLERQLVELFPDAKIIRLDGDTLVENPKKILENGWDIAIGTTVVVELVDWSEVGVAVIANVDNMLSTADFRADEETFRVVGTMASKCREVGAELIIQSSRLDYDAVNDAINNKTDKFYIEQIAQRQPSMFPPHSRMVKVEFRGRELRAVMEVAKVVEKQLRDIFAHRLSPLHQPMVERQRGEHIVQLLLKIERGRSSARAKILLDNALKNNAKLSARNRVTIEVQTDPQ